MIKRRFYKLEHPDGDDASDSSSSSSSSSDSELEAEAAEESVSEPVAEVEVKEDGESCSTSSGYESEDSSANEVDLDASGLPSSEDDAEIKNGRQILIDSQLSGKRGSYTLKTQSTITAEKESLPADFPACILKFKSVFKCRMCPRIVCLTEETIRAHLKSKRHSRSEKLQNEGRLKTMLNSDGEIENQETPAEMNARILAIPLVGEKKRFKKKKMRNDANIRKARQSTKSPVKKRRKNEK